MKGLSLVLFITMTAIAAVHAYWAFGGLWPAGTERMLIDTVVGDARVTAMPSTSSTLVVAVLIFLTGLIALAAGRSVNIRPFWLVRLFTSGVGAVYFARGVAGYFFETIAWKPVEPFATLNVWFYSPLCIVIAAAFFVLAMRPNK